MIGVGVLVVGSGMLVADVSAGLRGKSWGVVACGCAWLGVVCGWANACGEGIDCGGLEWVLVCLGVEVICC